MPPNINIVTRVLTLLCFLCLYQPQKMETIAYVKALDDAYRNPGSQKIFIVKPKKCLQKCQASIKKAEEIVGNMNLLRNVPFIITDAFSKNENLEIRIYDPNGKS